jgi:hypothetical protein
MSLLCLLIRYVRVQKYSNEETHLHEPTAIAADLPFLLDLIVQKRVGDRPDRCEPRAVKRRPKPYLLLTVPSAEAKERIEGGEILYPRIKYR